MTNFLSVCDILGYSGKSYTEHSISYEFNSTGFRDTEFKKDGILFFGCSYGFGVGVDAVDRYTNILESKLNIRCNNLCIPGSGSDTTARILPYWIEKLQPKIVVNHFMFPIRREIYNGDQAPILWLPSMDLPKTKIQEFIDEDYVYRKTVENIWNIKKCCNDNSARYVEYPKNINDFKAGDSKHPGPESHKQMANELFDIIENNHVLEFTNTDDYNNKHIYRQIQKFTV